MSVRSSSRISMVLADCHKMAARLAGAVASLILQVACVDRAMGDAPAPFDPAAEERTHAEILRDFCETYAGCELDTPLLDEPTCLWYFDFIATGFESAPEKPPECAVALWDRLACVSEADSCEDFKASLAFTEPATNHRCDEPLERFDEADCTSSESPPVGTGPGA